MTVDEHTALCREAREGKILIGVDRALARRFYSRVPIQKIEEDTGEALYMEKLTIVGAMMLSPTLLIVSMGLAAVAFQWWSALLIPIALFVWMGLSMTANKGGVKQFPLTVLLALSIICYFARWLPPSYCNPLIAFAASIWLWRFIYTASTSFLRAFVLRNYKAFLLLEKDIYFKKNA